MKKFIWVSGVLVLLCFGWFEGRDYFPGEDSGVEASLSTAKVVRRNIGQHISATGIVNPIIGAEVKVGSRISGTLERLHVTVGSRVGRGDIIARLDSLELEVKLAKARADLAEEMANLSLIKKGARPEEIQSAKHNLEKVKTDMSFAETNMARSKKLYAQKTLSRQDLDIAVWEWESAVSVFKSSQAQFELVETKYIKEDFDLAQARVAQSEAALREAEIKLSYTAIRAPISGVVTSVSTMEGETVAASQVAPTFVTITNLDRLQVDAYIDETDIGKIKKGQKARFTVDAYPDNEFTGKAFSISPKGVVQGNVITYDVRMFVDDPDHLLKPDMTAAVVFTLQERKNVLTVPQYAIRREGGRKFVMVFMGEKDPVRREVRTGWKEGGFVEITRGIKESEVIILK